MQFSTITKKLQPLLISTAIMGNSYAFSYNDIDLSSYLPAETNNQTLSQHISFVNSDIYSNIALKQTFEELYEKWQKNTMFFSFAYQITSDANYKKIVAMGKRVTPFILEKIKKKPSLIVWALNDIYQQKVSDNPSTTIEQACKLWVNHLS